MESRRNPTIASSIRVKNMQQRLGVYTDPIGFQTPGKVIRKDGRIAHASVGFDSPLIFLSPTRYTQTPQTKKELTKNKRSGGVEFYFGLNGFNRLDAFFAEVKAKGITVINEL